MNALRRKWTGCQGASILLALLFLLVCMMAGASVLMAAASNAGKIKSNKVEQQKYLTLSSALTLLCDELTGVEYVGIYSYTRDTVYRTELDPDGNAISVYDHDEHSYSQQPGTLRREADPTTPLGWAGVLPLYNDLDVAFANNFQVPAGQRSPIDRYTYQPRNTSIIQPTSPHALELTVNADDTYGGLLEPVKITAQLKNDGTITLTASLKNDPDYLMEAVLKPNHKPEDLLVLDSHEGNGAYETEPVKWTLEYVAKKEGAGG